MTDIKFLRRFNLIVFSILFVMGLEVFFFQHIWLDDYIKFVNTMATVLVPLVVIGAAGTPVKKLLENQKAKIENK